MLPWIRISPTSIEKQLVYTPPRANSSPTIQAADKQIVTNISNRAKIQTEPIETLFREMWNPSDVSSKWPNASSKLQMIHQNHVQEKERNYNSLTVFLVNKTIIESNKSFPKLKNRKDSVYTPKSRIPFIIIGVKKKEKCRTFRL